MPWRPVERDAIHLARRHATTRAQQHLLGATHPRTRVGCKAARRLQQLHRRHRKGLLGVAKEVGGGGRVEALLQLVTRRAARLEDRHDGRAEAVEAGSNAARWRAWPSAIGGCL